MVDKINALIQRSKYSENDIEDATCGQCGTFAIALYRFLTKHNVACQLVLFVEGTQKKPRGSIDSKRKAYKFRPFWRHVAVKVDNRFYDIRGRIKPAVVHKEFLTGAIMPISERDLIDELKYAETCRLSNEFYDDNDDYELETDKPYSPAKLRAWGERGRKWKREEIAERHKK